MIIAAVAGTGGALLVAASCLGLYAPEPVGTTETSASEAITETVASDASAREPPERSAARPESAEAPEVAEATAEDAGFPPVVLAPPAQQVAIAPPATQAGAGEDAGAIAVGDAGAAAAPEAGAEEAAETAEAPAEAGAPVAQEQVADAGAPDAEPFLSPTFPYSYNRPQSRMLGAGDFQSDAPPWTTSSWVPNPNAGAGQFTTEWVTPLPNLPTIPMVGLPPVQEQAPAQLPGIPPPPDMRLPQPIPPPQALPQTPAQSPLQTPAPPLTPPIP